MLRLVASAVVLVFFVCSGTAIDFDENGYSDVLVAISPDVPPTRAREIVDKLKEWISTGSRSLFVATKKLAYIKSVEILIPQTWTDFDDAELTSDYKYSDGVIRVDLPNPVYQTAPYTVQPTSCGSPGQYIHVTPDFLLMLTTESEANFGPTEKLFVTEWAKVRYGVFEEHGFPGDDRYPMFYYQSQWSLEEGTVDVLVPNFCTNKPLTGGRIDVKNGGSCVFDQMTGLPDSHCIFLPDLDGNDQVESSYMALPFLPNVQDFCQSEDGPHFHNKRRPTKHNMICNGKSVWSVMMQSPDFEDLQPMAEEDPPETKFQLLRQDADNRFVIILDVSDSMTTDNRIGRLQEVATTWILDKVNNGSKVGIVSFNDEPTVDKILTTLDSERVRKELASIIDGLKASGETCIGGGLLSGLEVLNGPSNNPTSAGGVVLLITDGHHTGCSGPEIDLENQGLLDLVVREKVRIVTMAFGAASDDNLENLATISHGETHFVPDGTGISDIDSAFEGSLTYQPAVPSVDQEVLIFGQTFKNPESGSINSSFFIDESVGRSVTFQVSFAQVTMENLVVSFPDGTADLVKPIGSKSPFVYKFSGVLKAGEHAFKVTFDGSPSYLDVKVVAKSKDGNTLPYSTKCWVGNGNEIDVNTTLITILAHVTQGNAPVFGAKVQALIMRGGSGTIIDLNLLDNGVGADMVADDGIYSRYFTQFEGSDMRYTLSCKVLGDDGTRVVSSTDATRNRRSAIFPVDIGPTSPVCCGSSVNTDALSSRRTGKFERTAMGGSFKVRNAPAAGQDVYPPGRIVDLKATVENSAFISVTFTSPGGDLDAGKADRYELKYLKGNDSVDLEEEYEVASSIAEESIIGDSLNDTKEAGERVEIEVQRSLLEENELYFLLAKAVDSSQKVGQLSNVVRICMGCSPGDDPADGLTAGQIAIIVLSSVGFVFAAAFLVYFVLSKTGYCGN